MDKNRGERDRLEVEKPLVKMEKTPGATRDSLWVRDRQRRGEDAQPEAKLKKGLPYHYPRRVARVFRSLLTFHF